MKRFSVIVLIVVLILNLCVVPVFANEDRVILSNEEVLLLMDSVSGLDVFLNTSDISGSDYMVVFQQQYEISSYGNYVKTRLCIQVLTPIDYNTSFTYDSLDGNRVGGLQSYYFYIYVDEDKNYIDDTFNAGNIYLFYDGAASGASASTFVEPAGSTYGSSGSLTMDFVNNYDKVLMASDGLVVSDIQGVGSDVSLVPLPLIEYDNDSFNLSLLNEAASYTLQVVGDNGGVDTIKQYAFENLAGDFAEVIPFADLAIDFGYNYLVRLFDDGGNLITHIEYTMGENPIYDIDLDFLDVLFFPSIPVVSIVTDDLLYYDSRVTIDVGPELNTDRVYLRFAVDGQFYHDFYASIQDTDGSDMFEDFGIFVNMIINPINYPHASLHDANYFYKYTDIDITDTVNNITGLVVRPGSQVFKGIDPNILDIYLYYLDDEGVMVQTADLHIEYPNSGFIMNNNDPAVSDVALLPIDGNNQPPVVYSSTVNPETLAPVTYNISVINEPYQETPDYNTDVSLGLDVGLSDLVNGTGELNDYLPALKDSAELAVDMVDAAQDGLNFFAYVYKDIAPPVFQDIFNLIGLVVLMSAIIGSIKLIFK